MSWSANEVEGLAAKAARGAGAPPEQAAWFGRATAVHLAQARDDADMMAALNALPGGPVIDVHLSIMALLTECDADGTATGHIAGPEGLVRSYLEALPFEVAFLQQNQGGTQVTLQAQRPRTTLPATRCNLSPTLLETMRSLAARTFVPETESSRQAGAGAGLLDND